MALVNDEVILCESKLYAEKWIHDIAWVGGDYEGCMLRFDLIQDVRYSRDNVTIFFFRERLLVFRIYPTPARWAIRCKSAVSTVAVQSSRCVGRVFLCVGRMQEDPPFKLVVCPRAPYLDDGAANKLLANMQGLQTVSSTHTSDAWECVNRLLGQSTIDTGCRWTRRGAR